ncbi:venom metalloproteinase BumaMPs1-like [Amblyomma americanum]
MSILWDHEEQPQESPEPRKADTKAPPANYELELYFIGDYNHTIYFNNQTEDRVAYATIFLHSVGLRLSQLDPPIAVVVTAIQGSFTDNESYVSHYEGARIDASGTLKKLAEHFNKESNMKNADAILMAAGRHLVKFEGGKVTSLQGLAFIGQACRLHKTSIAQDKPGKFNGINTAAHEIGHLLGAFHDGDKNKIAQNCSANGRHLMSKHGGGFDFSNCSKELIADFVT